MIMVTNLNYFRHSAAGISCEVHVISFRGGRLTSLAIHFRNRRVYLFSKCFVFARWTIQLQIMCASSNIRTTTHARGITSGYQSINGPSNHASLRTQHTRRMCPQVRTFPGPDFHFQVLTFLDGSFWSSWGVAFRRLQRLSPTELCWLL